MCHFLMHTRSNLHLEICKTSYSAFNLCVNMLVLMLSSRSWGSRAFHLHLLVRIGNCFGCMELSAFC